MNRDQVDASFADGLLAVWGAVYVFWGVFQIGNPPDPYAGLPLFGGYESITLALIVGTAFLAGATGRLPTIGYAILGVFETMHLTWLLFYGASFRYWTFVGTINADSVGATIIIVATIATILFARGLSVDRSNDSD